ncbi:MAG: hypothetical protein EA377_12710 [Phycisphaerales bacterium]|nr:MAG: hypothetical protein EA377_12710 [Phycisphaerales bacterium]
MFDVYCPWRGFVAPIALAAIGVVCLVTQTAWLPGRRSLGLVLHGTPAILMGVMFLCWALGLHLRHVWMSGKYLLPVTNAIGSLAYIAAVSSAIAILWLILSDMFF